jgi:hypothetical protein
MTKFSKRLIQAAKEAVEIARGNRPARVHVRCASCGQRILINYLPAPKEKFICAECNLET